MLSVTLVSLAIYLSNSALDTVVSLDEGVLSSSAFLWLSPSSADDLNLIFGASSSSLDLSTA